MKATRRSMVCIFLLMLVSSMMVSNIGIAKADIGKGHKCTSVKQFEKDLSKAYADNRLSSAERADLLINTDNTVLSDFFEEKTDKAIEVLNKIDDIEFTCDGKGECSIEKRVYLGDQCFVEILIKDCPEKTLADRMAFIMPDSANAVSRSGNSVVWKKYGNRYYTAKTTVFYGVAWGEFALENHYKLSSKGVTERYGDAYSADSGLARVSEGTPTITTSKATKMGKSVSMRCNYKVKYGYNPVEWTRSYRMISNVKYVDKDSINKEIKVNQNWTFKSL